MSRSSAKTIRQQDIEGFAPTGGAFAPGSVVAGKYVVERRLGRGGIGIVVLALHSELGQRVAIKYLKPEVLENRALLERFRREAQLAAGLQSEHVVRVYDVGVHPTAGPFIVMEFLEGTDLASTIKDGPLPVGTAVEYLLHACDAVGEAHALGIVHRDLKPENLFLARRGSHSPIVKVLDFGFSKISSTEGQCTVFSRLTTQGERFGTLLFMPPEQLVSAEDVDCRSDIWSLGVVLFELLTTKLPFDGETTSRLAKNIFSAAPKSVRAIRPEIPRGIEAIVDKCLAKDPADRYPDIAALVAALSRYRTGIAPRPSRIPSAVTSIPMPSPVTASSFSASTSPSAAHPSSRSSAAAAAVARRPFVHMAGAVIAAVALTTVGIRATVDDGAPIIRSAASATVLHAHAASMSPRQRAESSPPAPSATADSSERVAVNAPSRPVRVEAPRPAVPPLPGVPDDGDIRRSR